MRQGATPGAAVRESSAAASWLPRATRWRGILFLALLLFGIGASLQPAPAVEPLSVDTPGGLKIGARIVRVTTLVDSGPGSLRDALSASGPRVILFDVGGYIDLQSDLSINKGDVTIAGETAPAPGVVIRGATLRIRASDVMIRHITVMPGASPDPKIAEKRDGVSIYGSVSRHNLVRNVVLKNISVGWAVDENIGMQGLVDGVRIERSLIFEGLRHGGHPKGGHSMNMVAGAGVLRVLVLGNVFASSDTRSPRFTNANLVAILNNLIYGTGKYATHFDSSSISGAGAVMDVIGNVYKPSADTRCKFPMIKIDPKILESTPPTRIFLSDNAIVGDMEGCAVESTSSPSGDTLEQAPAWNVPRWTLTPANMVYPDILTLAGARPAARDAIGARVVAGIRDGSERAIDNESSAGGWPALPSTTRPTAVPLSTMTVHDAADLSALAAWLCRQRKAVEGLDSNCD